MKIYWSYYLEQENKISVKMQIAAYFADGLGLVACIDIQICTMYIIIFTSGVSTCSHLKKVSSQFINEGDLNYLEPC